MKRESQIVPARGIANRKQRLKHARFARTLSDALSVRWSKILRPRKTPRLGWSCFANQVV